MQLSLYYRKLQRYLENEIVIELSPERFTFKSDQSSKTIETYFYITATPTKIIVSAGEVYSGPKAASRFSIFEDLGGLEVSNHALLNQFLRYGCACVLHGFKTAMRPTMTFVNSESLSRVLNGNQRAILDIVGKSAGARVIKFAK